MSGSRRNRGAQGGGPARSPEPQPGASRPLVLRSRVSELCPPKPRLWSWGCSGASLGAGFGPLTASLQPPASDGVTQARDAAPSPLELCRDAGHRQASADAVWGGGMQRPSVLTWKHPRETPTPHKPATRRQQSAAWARGATRLWGWHTEEQGWWGGLSEPGAFVLCLGCWKAAPTAADSGGASWEEQGFLC